MFYFFSIRIYIKSVLCSGISEADFDTILEGTLVASSTKGNPVKLSKDELLSLLKEAY